MDVAVIMSYIVHNHSKQEVYQNWTNSSGKGVFNYFKPSIVRELKI